MASNTKVMLQRDASGNGFMLSHESFNKWLQTMTSAPLKGKHRWTTQWFLFFHNKNLFHVGFCLFTKHISLDTNTSIYQSKKKQKNLNMIWLALKENAVNVLNTGNYCCIAGWITLIFYIKIWQNCIRYL